MDRCGSRPRRFPESSDRLLHPPRPAFREGLGPGRRPIDRGRGGRRGPGPRGHRRAALPSAGPTDDPRPFGAPFPRVRPRASAARHPVLPPHPRPDANADGSGDAASSPARVAGAASGRRLSGRRPGPPRDTAQASRGPAAPEPATSPRPRRRGREASDVPRRARRGDPGLGRPLVSERSGDARRRPFGRTHAPASPSGARSKETNDRSRRITGRIPSHSEPQGHGPCPSIRFDEPRI